MYVHHDNDDGGAFPWMAERRALIEQYNHNRHVPARAPRDRRVPLSQVRSHVRACEDRPEIMRAWASAPVDGEIPDEDWDLITDFNAYLWIKCGCSQEALDAIGRAVRRLAHREFESSESEAFIAHLLGDPRIVDDRR